MSKGILVVVSGFSGSGKGTVMKRLMEKYDNYALSVSVTTRNPRPGEKDGEAYFFRAYWHFYLLTRFGDIPIMDDFWDENATLAGLQIPAAKRSDVAWFILNDLKAAIGQVPEVRAELYPRSKYKGLRISKEAAVLLAMRVALYEASWEKYHKGTDFATEDNSAEFYQEVLNWGDQQLFPSGLTLNTIETDKDAVNTEDAFAHLFNTKDLSEMP